MNEKRECCFFTPCGISHKIAVVVPMGPDDEKMPGLPLPFSVISHIWNFRGAGNDFTFPDFCHHKPLGITRAIQAGVEHVAQWQPDIIAVCYSAAYRPFLADAIRDHLETGADVTITNRVNPKWGKWTGRLGSRLAHHAARLLLGLPFKDNCSGLYVFTNDQPMIVRHIFRGLKSREHFFDTELRWRILKYYRLDKINQFDVEGVVTGGNTLNRKVVWDTVSGFARLVWERIKTARG